MPKRSPKSKLSIELGPWNRNRNRKKGRSSKANKGESNSRRKVTFVEEKENAVRLFHSLLPAENNAPHRDVLRDVRNVPSHMVLRPLPGKVAICSTRVRLSIGLDSCTMRVFLSQHLRRVAQSFSVNMTQDQMDLYKLENHRII